MNLRKNGKNMYELKGLVIVGLSYGSSKVCKVNYDFSERKLNGENAPSKLIKRVRELEAQGYEIICNDKVLALFEARASAIFAVH